MADKILKPITWGEIMETYKDMPKDTPIFKLMFKTDTAAHRISSPVSRAYWLRDKERKAKTEAKRIKLPSKPLC